MDRSTPQSKPTKRPLYEEFNSTSEGSRKRPALVPNVKKISCYEFEKIFNFFVLLPNGKSVEVKVNETRNEIPLDEFVDKVKQEYMRASESKNAQRPVNWSSDDLHFVEDLHNTEIRNKMDLRIFKQKSNRLLLKDGLKEASTFENMWDLTPHTDLLMELPSEYTFETALADLIDNSLQAVWSNKPNERVIRVQIQNDKIVIFDTGPGMDGSDENSLAKWGKMGASLHRSSRTKGIGGKPPYLVPYFGMFGYGGAIASMHLGRSALVSSKTKRSKRVYMLRLERQALLSCSSSENRWRTEGGLRYPSSNELNNSFGSFTKVEIKEPKIMGRDLEQLKCKLKDIYFPYIQCDAGKTITPIQFEVNGTNLAEIEGGEVAITNLLSSNGQEFEFQLRFITNATLSSRQSTIGQGSKPPEGNARVRCAYFPIKQGKETIENILEELEAKGYGINENFWSFSHVSIRRLGRLLPDARWQWLPFMDFRQRKVEKAQILKRCCFRVKCYIETDAGFTPTPSKTDLAAHHPYTTVLRNLGNKSFENDKEVDVEIYIDGKQVTLQVLDKKYQEWILQMHSLYDKEIDSGADLPTFVINPRNKKELGVSEEVLRVHKAFPRKGIDWKSGQKIKVVKGACPGFHKSNVYATLEFIILEGCQGDAGGEARIICRPINVPDEKAAHLSDKDGITAIELCSSISLPFSVIDTEKCVPVGDNEWNSKLEKLRQKVPSSIDLLSSEQCQEIQVGEALPEDTVDAGHRFPKEIVAVIRPAVFDCTNSSQSLDQKFIVKEKYEMILDIKFDANDGNSTHIFSSKVTSSSCNILQGLYVFSMRETPRLFEKAGVYTFLLSLKEATCMNCEKKVHVKGSTTVGSWNLLNQEPTVNLSARAGSCFPPLSVACYDRYSNRIPFKSNTKVMIKFGSQKDVVIHAVDKNVTFSQDKSTMIIKDLQVNGLYLDKIRPNYEVTLQIFPEDKSFILSVPCQVFPGHLDYVTCPSSYIGKQLLPGQTIKSLVFETFDAYGNHLKKNENVEFCVDGFCFQDNEGLFRKVDDHGCLNLGGKLKVTKGFGERAAISVKIGDKFVFIRKFDIGKRKLRAAFEVPVVCYAGSRLEELIFEVVDGDGEVDKNINEKDEYGIFHTLKIKSDTFRVDDSVQYTFRNGYCTVRSIPLPEKEGVYSLVASHSSHPELYLNIELKVEQAVIVGNEMITTQSSEENLLLFQGSPSLITPQQKNDEAEHRNSDGNLLLLQGSPSLIMPQREIDVAEHQNSNGNLLLLQDSPSLVTPQRKYKEAEHQNSDGNNFLLQNSSSSQDVLALIMSTIDDQKELEDAMFKYGISTSTLKKNVKILEDKKSKLEKDVSNLQATIAHYGCDVMDKEVLMEKIFSKRDSAAAVVYKLLGSSLPEKKHQKISKDILGMVALLGKVQSKDLSRMLAQFLGKDQMLAIVCKSYSSASKFAKNNQPNVQSAFDELASSLGYSVNGNYLVICLEKIWPYKGKIGKDAQGKLCLPDPISNGKPPAGYLGHAVNMILLDENQMKWRTYDDHGLRETLFYHLFGELQVYDDWDSMNRANLCNLIKDGAVSLDGGIIKGHGDVSVVSREPIIQFPVVSTESQVYGSPFRARNLKLMEELNTELKETNIRLDEERKAYEKTMKKFIKIQDKFSKFSAEKGPSISNLRRLYSSQLACDQRNLTM